MLWQISQSISPVVFLFYYYRSSLSFCFLLFCFFIVQFFYNVSFKKEDSLAGLMPEEHRSACTAQGDRQRLRNVAAHIALIGFTSVTLAMDLQADGK